MAKLTKNFCALLIFTESFAPLVYSYKILINAQGCQIFFAAYGQNPDKNGQNVCFFKLWPKSQDVLTMIISS